MANGVITTHTTLSYGDTAENLKLLTNLQEVPELGGDTEAIETTTLDDEAHTYINGIKSYGDSIQFKFLFEKEQFTALNAIANTEKYWAVQLPASVGVGVIFKGVPSIKLDSVSVNSALTYTLSVKPTSAMEWATA